MIDKHGAPIWPEGRVMVEGGLVGTITAADRDTGKVTVAIDGQDREVTVECKPLVWGTDELESLGDGINQAMRAAQGQPN